MPEPPEEAPVTAAMEPRRFGGVKLFALGDRGELPFAAMEPRRFGGVKVIPAAVLGVEAEMPQWSPAGSAG